jgi:hypothetical protein
MRSTFLLAPLPALLLACLGASPVRGADAAMPRRAEAVRLAADERVELDGRLDEGLWRRTPAASDLRQREPVSGAAASEPTEIRIAYDETALYLGIVAGDSEPNEIIARLLHRDRVMEPDLEGSHVFGGDDAVAVLLDPFHDQRNGFVFATNPNGAAFDALVTDENGTFNDDWDGVWSVAATRLEHGWSAELRVPFRTLRYPEGDESPEWGFNVYRVVRRKNEELLWSGWSREDGGFHRVSRAGRLDGLRHLPRPGINAELKVYGLGGQLEDGTGHQDSWEAGADLKWELRPGLVLDSTVNPDFAQVESDRERVNLTRFDLFFPEKREFFLENAGIFEYGANAYFETPPFLMFFSRRIGLSETGEEIPVLGGGRLSGRLGHQTLGALGMVTDEAAGVPETRYSALRWKRDLGASGYLGAMVTDRRNDVEANTVGGIDWSFWPTGSLNVQGFVARTETRGTGGDDLAYRVGVDYEADRWGFSGQHIVVGTETRADLGFVTRTDIRRTDGLGRYTVRPDRLGLRRIDLLLGVTHIESLDHVTQDWSVGPAIDLLWSSGDRFRLFVADGFTRLPEGFPVGGRVPVEVGAYDTTQLSFFAVSSPHRRLAGALSGDHFRIYGGELTSLSGELLMARGAHLAVHGGYTWDRVDLPAGTFDAGLPSLRVDWALSTKLTLRGYFQYNDLEDRFVTNLRLALRYRPGSDFYLVFDDERGTGARIAPDRRGIVAKLTYLHRL